MTKIPTVEDKVVTEFFTKCRVHLRSNHHGRCAVEHALVQALTAEREAMRQEIALDLRETFMEDDGEDSYIQLSARIVLFIRKLEKQHD